MGSIRDFLALRRRNPDAIRATGAYFSAAKKVPALWIEILDKESMVF